MYSHVVLFVLISTLAVLGEDYKLSGPNFDSNIKQSLKRSVTAGKLVKPPGKNSYKLGEALKKASKKPVSRDSFDS